MPSSQPVSGVTPQATGQPAKVSPRRSAVDARRLREEAIDAGVGDAMADQRVHGSTDGAERRIVPSRELELGLGRREGIDGEHRVHEREEARQLGRFPFELERRRAR